MDISKKDLIDSFIPEVVLVPMNNESQSSIVEKVNDKKLICLNSFPFRIGRESRISENERGIFVKLRILNTKTTPNNDIYLVNSTSHMEISKEHFLIEKKDENYFIKDRNSSMGTKLNGQEIGKDKSGELFSLNDGDIVKIGSSASKFEYKFLILKNTK